MAIGDTSGNRIIKEEHLSTNRDQPRLGRGLSSLISPTVPPTQTPAIRLPKAVEPAPPAAAESPLPRPTGQPGVHWLNLSTVHPNPKQPRKAFDRDRLAALADSLKQDGMLQPVVVRRAGNDYELVAGERRWRAAQLAGMQLIPAFVRDVDSRTQFELALIENLQREDLNPVERARAYSELAMTHGLSHEQIAKRVGDDRSNVSNYLRILDLDDDSLAKVASGELQMGHARSLLGLGDVTQRAALVRRIISERWSVRQVEEFVRGATRGASSAPTAPPAQSKQRPVIADLEQRLSDVLGLRVRIKESRRRGSGRVMIEYHSFDDFDRIAQRLGMSEPQ